MTFKTVAFSATARSRIPARCTPPAFKSPCPNRRSSSRQPSRCSCPTPRRTLSTCWPHGPCAPANSSQGCGRRHPAPRQPGPPFSFPPRPRASGRPASHAHRRGIDLPGPQRPGRRRAHPRPLERRTLSVNTSVSNRLIVLVLAACLSAPCHPTVTRIAGSWASRSASLVSS